jgi:hypothetical protein
MALFGREGKPSLRYRGIPSLGESCGADPGVSVGDMSLPITGKINALAGLDRQSGYAAHLIAIRHTAVKGRFPLQD